MEITELKAKIQSNNVPSFLAFTGDEWAVQKIYINQIATRNNLDIRYMDSVYEVIPKLGNKKFISTKKDCLYLVRDDTKFLTDEKGWANVESMLGNNHLILLISKLDKRIKFASTYKNAIVEFSALKPQILKKYIQKEIALSDKSCDKLIEVCEGNYGRILLEIDKIKQYAAHFQDSSVNEFFKTLLEDGTIYTPPKDAIFDLVDAVLDRKAKEAFDLLTQCNAINESSFAILTNLFNNAKAVLQVQTCTSRDISKSTGLIGWQIINAKKHLDVYDNEELKFMLKLINNCVHAIKIGTIEEKYVMEYILVRVL